MNSIWINSSPIVPPKTVLRHYTGIKFPKFSACGGLILSSSISYLFFSVISVSFTEASQTLRCQDYHYRFAKDLNIFFTFALHSSVCKRAHSFVKHTQKIRVKIMIVPRIQRINTAFFRRAAANTSNTVSHPSASQSFYAKPTS